MCRAVLPGMIEKQRGDVFLISSMSGKKGDPGSASYNASKFGLQGFAQALTYEVRQSNIRVMVLNPSSVNTGVDEGPPHGKGLKLHAADIAATIVHLASLPGRTLIRDMDIWGTNPG
jgi:3-oxoacyl-[acyl-carrier protein] reductase